MPRPPQMPNARFKPELITGSGGARMSDAAKEASMAQSVAKCPRAM